VEGRPSRLEDVSPRAVLRIYGAAFSLGYPFLPENEARALRDARAIVKKIERGEIPDPRTKRRAATLVSEPAAAGVSTFASSQAAFFRLKLQPRPDETDPRAARRHETKRRGYRAAFKAVFPHDAILTDATITAAIEAWSLNPQGARRRRKRGGDVEIYRRPLTKASAETVRVRIKTYIRFCLAKRWITVNPFDALDAPSTVKTLPPKIHDITPAERRALMRSIAIFSRVPRRRVDHAELERFPDFIRLLGLSGMRLGEAATLRLEAYIEWPERENVVTGDVILLYDTKRWRADRPSPPRIVSYRLFPELSAVIDRQRPYAERHGGHLWPWRTEGQLQTQRKWIAACIATAGIVGRTDPFHVFRSIASAHYDRLGLPPELIGKLLGHSPAVNATNYTSSRDLVARNRRAIEAELARYLPAYNPRPITTDQSRLIEAL
jgi:integrase